MSQPTPQQHITDAYNNVTSTEALEKEASVRQDARIQEQQAAVSDKLEDLVSIMKDAHEKHGQLKTEQNKLATASARDIDQLIQEAKTRQENAHEAKRRDIRQKHDEIKRLQLESDKKFKAMSPEEREQ